VANFEKPACFQVLRDVMWLLWFWGALVDVWCLTLVVVFHLDGGL
jgi:hypothetical protein